jgi:hypothetical protein
VNELQLALRKSMALYAEAVAAFQSEYTPVTNSLQEVLRRWQETAESGHEFLGNLASIDLASIDWEAAFERFQSTLLTLANAGGQARIGFPSAKPLIYRPSLSRKSTSS